MFDVIINDLFSMLLPYNAGLHCLEDFWEEMMSKVSCTNVVLYYVQPLVRFLLRKAYSLSHPELCNT